MKALICNLFGHKFRPAERSASLCESTSWYDGAKLGTQQGVQLTIRCERCGHWTHTFVEFGDKGGAHVGS